MPRTHMAKPGEVERRWRIVDISGLTLGRACSRIATVLRGKHRPDYTPHVDTGDFVVVINAEKVHLTGKKWSDKIYRRHSQYPGGMRTWTAAQIRQERPEDLVKLAVKRMLPNTPLGRQMFRKLRVYAGAAHPHQAQQPEPLTL